MDRIPARFLLLAACAALTAAAPRGQDDRERSTPVETQWHWNQVPANVQAIRSRGFRISDIDVVTSTPLRFAVSYVKNTGSYYRAGATWYYGSLSFIQSKLGGRRLTRLVPYWDGQRKFVATMVANTGAQAKSWRHFAGDWNVIKPQLTGMRVIDITAYTDPKTTNIQYAVIAIANTGKDARRSVVLTNTTEAAIVSAMRHHGMRLSCMDISSKKYSAVLVKDPSPAPRIWWATTRSRQEIESLVAQKGARLISHDLHYHGASDYVNAVMIDNLNDHAGGMRDRMEASGARRYGFLLSQLGADDRAALMTEATFEPSRALPLLHHYHAMREVGAGRIRTSTLLTVYRARAGTCPVRRSRTLEPLRTVLERMMKFDDDNRTVAVEDRFGRAALHLTAQRLGMKGTRINRTIGCSGTPNTMTLADARQIVTAVEGGRLGVWESTFYALMASAGLDTVIGEEARRMGLRQHVIDAFKVAARHAGKSASSMRSFRYHKARFGWLRLPFRVGGRVQNREYFLGAYLHHATDNTRATAAFNDVWKDLARNEIRAALASWKNAHSPGGIAVFGTGCNSFSGKLRQTFEGVPEIGQQIALRIGSALPLRPAVLTIGASRTRWGRLALPLDLTPLGAPGCTVYADIAVALVKNASLLGAARFDVRVPNQRHLIGQQFYTQGLALGVSNGIGVATSNGIKVLLDGLR